MIKQRYKDINPAAKAALWYTVCNVLMKGISLLSTPIFTRILSEESYGTFTIFQSWFNILIIFTSLNAFMGGFTKGLLVYKNDQDGFTSASLGLTTIITLIFGLFLLIAPSFWSDLFELDSSLLLALFLELLLMPAMDFWAARKRFDYKYKEYVIITLAMSVGCISVAIITVLNSENRLFARVYSDAIIKSLFCAVLFVIIVKRGKRLIKKEYWKYTLSFNLPLMPHFLSTYVLGQSDRLMIGKMVGTSQAAYYGVAYTIASMMNLVMTALNNALNPYIFKSIESRCEDRIKKSTAPLFLLMASLCVLTMALAPEVVYIFAGSKYSEAVYVIPPVAASVYFIFLYAMFSSIEFYFQKTKLIASATVICAIMNLILNFVFIKIAGYYAAGYTTLFCYICLALFHHIFYKKVVFEELGEQKELFNTKIILLGACVVIGIMIIMLLLYQYRIIRFSILFVIAILLLSFKGRIKAIFVSLKK